MYNSVWYENLTKPFLAPPDWIFVPVWGILYLLIILSLIFYILKHSDDKKTGYIFFTVQLLLNLVWSPIFFVYKNIFLALIVVILLNIFIFLTIKSFYRISEISGILLIPYFIWVLFAAYLNLGYFILNY